MQTITALVSVVLAALVCSCGDGTSAAPSALGGRGGEPIPAGGMTNDGLGVGGAAASPTITGGMAGLGDGGSSVESPGCGDGLQQIELGERCDEGPNGGPDCTATCNTRYEALFHPDAIPTFYLTIPLESWNTLASCSRDENQRPARPIHCNYQAASVHVVYDPDPTDADPTTVESEEMSVGLRRKGRATWRDLEPPPLDWTGDVFDRPGKPSLKLKFDRFGGPRFLGLTRVTLNSGVQDPSGVRERLAYYLHRSAGSYAPMANSARVYVRVGDATDYDYWGVYANVQTLDKRFIKFHFGEIDGRIGNLYDTFNDVYFTELDRCSDRGQAGEAPGAQEGRFQLETNEALGQTADLTAVIDSVYEYGSGGLFAGCRDASYLTETFVSKAETALDFDYLLREFATDFVFTNWDGYAATRNNYKLYHELARDRFVLFPWGTDQSFSWQDGVYYPNWTYSFVHQSSGHSPSHVMNRCIADATVCWPRYLEHVREVHALFDSLPLRELATSWRSQIAPFIEWSTTEFDRHGLFLDQYLENRSACVRAQLDGLPCPSLGCPDASGCDPNPRP